MSVLNSWIEFCYLFADYFQMIVAGRIKFLTILLVVFLGTILIHNACKFSSEKVNSCQLLLWKEFREAKENSSGGLWPLGGYPPNGNYLLTKKT